MTAAWSAACHGAEVLLLEAGTRPGRKLELTGNGRCNLTNLDAFNYDSPGYRRNGKFLIPALSAFGPESVIRFFESNGVAISIEDSGRVYPESQRAADVVTALWRALRSKGVDAHLEESVKAVRPTGEVITTSRTYRPDSIILATGGLSYPQTGSTGTGLHIAQSLGHNIEPVYPSMVPVIVSERWVKDLAGITLPDVFVRLLREDGKTLARWRGGLLFTHNGLSGPAVLEIGEDAARALYEGNSPSLCVNPFPEYTPAEFRQRVLGSLKRAGRRKVRHALSAFLPRALVDHLLSAEGIPPDVTCAQLNRQQRETILPALHNICFQVIGTLGIRSAMVTSGGVSVKEVDPRTCRSRLVPFLYFAGEILDITGRSGGYNLQAAFSTGYLAGLSAARP